MAPEKHAWQGEPSAEVEVVVDGTPLQITPFVRNIVASVVLGMVTSLKGAEKARSIQVNVRRKK